MKIIPLCSIGIMALLAGMILSGCGIPDPEKTPSPEVIDEPTPDLTLPSGSEGGLIAFSSDRIGGQLDIYAINADGTEVTQITNTRLNELAPSWSPDGNLLAFLTASGSRLSLTIMDLSPDPENRAPIRQINMPQADLIESPPAWSADGQKLVFAAAENGNADLYWVDINHGALNQLTFTSWSEIHPDISADGSKLVFSSNRFGNYDLFEIAFTSLPDIDPDTARRITDHPADELHASWSPLGNSILFTSTRAGQKDLFQIRNYEEDPTAVLAESSDEWTASVSPDGDKFVYARFNFDDSLNDLYLASISNPVPIPLISDQFDNWWPDWRP